MKILLKTILAWGMILCLSVVTKAQPIITLDTTIDATCNASADGEVQISVAGTPTFTYQWSNGATTQDISGLFGGTYQVTVTDGVGGQSVGGPYTVNAPSTILVNTDSIIGLSCFGATDGGVNISVSGGTPGYTYVWSNGATTQDVTGLSAGPANVTISDANGCTASAKSIFIDSLTPITATAASIQNISCNGANDGAIDIIVNGGVGNFSYIWSNGATTQDLTGLATGNYTVTVADSNSCTVVFGPQAITQPAVLAINLDSIHSIACNGDADGAVFISPTGGTTPYTYQWSNTQTTQNITGLNGANYTVTVTDSLGCTATSGPHTVNEPPILLVVTDTIIQQTCPGDGTGAVDLTVTGGTPNYSYIWSNGATTQDVSGLYAGTHDVTVTDANGCTASAKSLFIDSIPPIVITLDSINHVSCNGAADGFVQVSVTGGNGAASNYTYAWSNGATTQDITGLSGGSYTITVTDSLGCTMASGPHIVNEPTLLTLTFDSLAHVDCNGNANGAVWVTPNGGTTPYNYNWSNGATTQDITGLSGGSYSVTLTDANGCVDSTGPHIVNEPLVLTATIDSVDNVSCNGANDGRVFTSVNGGTTPYSYNWSNGATTQDITGLNGGNYTLTITDSNNCVVTIDTTLQEPTVLTTTLDSIQDVSCNGFGDGGVFVTASGGTTAYVYNWSNGSTTQDLTGLNGGSYTLTVTDANGCTATTGPHVVNEPAGMNITLDTIIDVSCNGANDGAVQITVTNGTPAYTYNWSNGATTQDIAGLNGDSYTVTVTDANGCTLSSGPHDVQEDSLIVITLDTIIDVSCNGANDGAVQVTVVGGVPTYTYNWSNGATTQDINGLGGGSYTLTVTDASSCTVTSGPHTVNEPTPLVVTFDSLTNVDCNGAANGAVFITTTGGTTNYTFNWSTGATTADITGLNGGNYTVTVTDANGCTATSGPHTVNEPTALAIALDSIDQVSCNGAADGAVFITASGGTTAYTYNWSNSGTTQNITGLSGGSYTLTVTDANGCTATSGPHVVPEAPALQLTFDSVQNVSCNGANDGGVFVTTTGGVPTYVYNWDNGATTQDITALAGGTYSVTATDADGCTATSGPHTVNEPATLTATLDSIEAVSCNGGNDGAVFLTIAGGTTPYVYNWDNGATTQDITGLSAGTYNLTVTDSNNCVVTTGPHNVTEPTLLQITLDSINNVSCNGAANGGVFITASGGTTAYTYNWSNGATTQNATGLNGGNYSVTATDANGCTATTGPHTVIEPNVLQVVVDTFKNESCDGIVDGFIHTSATGGTAPFSFLWSTNATTSNVTGLVAGSYSVTITDSNSCTAIDTVTINDIPTITVAVNLIDSVSCFGLSDGSIDLNISGGAPSYTYNWTTGATTQDLNNLAIGSYSITVTDSLGCEVTDGAFDVLQPDSLLLSASISNVSCNGAADGSIAVTTTGGTPSYTYNWTPNGATTEDLTNISGGSYSITVVDRNGCSFNLANLVVGEPTAIVLTSDSTAETCDGRNDGAINLTVTGGEPSIAGYTYNWNTGTTTQDLSNISGGNYTVTVTDSLGCSQTLSTNVYDPAALNLAITATTPLEGCLGEAIGVLDATASGGTGTLSYAWSNGTSTGLNPNLNAGTYSVVVTDVNGCTITDSAAIGTPIYPLINPYIEQTGTQDTTINWGSLVTIDASNNQSGVSYAWTETTTVGNLNIGSSTDPSTTIEPQPNGTAIYILLLTATSMDGCVDTASMIVRINIADLLGMPTAFTPNNDGTNDSFRPVNLDPQFITEFKIFNRWGQLVYDNPDTSNGGWDGTMQGTPQPRDTYIYLLHYQLPGAEERVVKGECTLLR